MRGWAGPALHGAEGAAWKSAQRAGCSHARPGAPRRSARCRQRWTRRVTRFAFADDPWKAERVPVPIPVPVYVPVPMHMYSQSVPVPATLPVPVSRVGSAGPGHARGWGRSATVASETRVGEAEGGVWGIPSGWGGADIASFHTLPLHAGAQISREAS